MRGTWNVTRHGPKPPKPAVLAFAGATVAVEPEPVPAWIVAGLGAAGLRYVQDSWREVTKGWTTPKLVLLREGGLLVDWLDAHRGDEGERQAQRLLLQILHALEE